MNRTRAYRIYKRQLKIKQRLNKIKDFYGKSKTMDKKYKGQYNKTHIGDCGRPKCLLCHYRKIFNVRKQINIQGILNEY